MAVGGIKVNTPQTTCTGFFLPFLYEPSGASSIRNTDYFCPSTLYKHLVPESVADGACSSAVDDVIYEMPSRPSKSKMFELY